MRTLAAGLSLLSLVAACSDSGMPADLADAAPSVSPIGVVPKEAQRTGDPKKGYAALVNEGYVGCGVPYSAFKRVVGAAPDNLRLAGRTGTNATMAYNMTAFDLDGIEVVTPNCLQCHAETLNGKLVIGLGNNTADYTADVGGFAVLAGALVKDPAERTEWEKWKDRMVAISPYVLTKTLGANPADNLATVLFSHRDPKTLAWSYDPLIPLPPPVVVPVNVPPWWNMKKKNAMFYDAAGRGDHARIMMTASTLCVDTVDEARKIDAYFPDVEAYILSLEPPTYPFEVDATLAAQGKTVFAASCASCHGSYEGKETYPNLVVATDEVGTDSTLAAGTAQFAGAFVDWFNTSFFGELARLAPAPGYIAPPLDGVWATAPYLHNGSVPTLATLLDSSTRPTYWTRTYDNSDYDQAAVGWHFTALDAGQDAEPDKMKKKLIYDTTQLGYGKGGHTYGDALTADQRTALLEYLKTI